MKTRTKTKTETAASIGLRVENERLKAEIARLDEQSAEKDRQRTALRREAEETVETLNFRILSLERQNVALRDSLTVTEGALMQLRAKQS